MELVMAGLLIGVSGMLALLIIAVWKDTAASSTDMHRPHKGTNVKARHIVEAQGTIIE